jgi:hypothetical protein
LRVPSCCFCCDLVFPYATLNPPHDADVMKKNYRVHAVKKEVFAQMELNPNLS